MTSQERTWPVSAIRNGTVIDHITAGQALKIVLLLKLARHQKLVTLGLNLPSKTMTYKDLIKVEERELTPEEANQVAILSPKSTINIIQEYEVIKKFQVKLPPMLSGVFSCPNPKCISNHEAVTSSFSITQRHHSILLQCKFCRKTFSQNDIVSSI
jgi:aspartate carbamoyltransferase regulatory subunit